MSAVEEQLKDLLGAMKTTAGCRFIAAKRLEERERGLTRLTAFTSAYVVVLTVLPYFLAVSKPVADWLNLFTVGCGIVILIASLLQSSSGDIVNAEQHHRSALEINELRRELKVISDRIDAESLIRFAKEYNGILQKYSVNHDAIDYDRYRIQRSEDFPWLSRFDRFVIRIKLVFSKYLPSITLVAISTLVFGLLARFGWPIPA